MQMGDKLLNVSGSPHVHGEESVKKIMWSVVIALMPAFFQNEKVMPAASAL